MDSPTVGYIKGDDLYASVRKALETIADDIHPKSRVIIKPNFVTTKKQLAATEVDEVRAIADFFEERCDEIIVAESSASGRAPEGYENYGYYDKLSNVTFMDLDDEGHSEVQIFEKAGGMIGVSVSRVLMDEHSTIVSAAKIKTHNCVVATLAAKNVIMASALQKQRMHQGLKATHRNLVEVMKHLHIDLAVMDGINAMEGNGPGGGTHINAGCVIASTDYLAADRVALEVMGIDPAIVGYLTYLHELGLGEYDLDQIEIVGDEFEVVPFRMHDNFEGQLDWR